MFSNPQCPPLGIFSTLRCYTVTETRNVSTFLIDFSVRNHFYRLNHCHCIVNHRAAAVNFFTRGAVRLDWVWTFSFTLIFRKAPCGTIAKAEASITDGSRIILCFLFAKVTAHVVVILRIGPFLCWCLAQFEATFIEKKMPPVVREVKFWLRVLLSWMT